MSGNRGLAHGEKRLALFTSEKGRDRANARRAIEGLQQNDKMIALLTEILVETQEGNAMRAELLRQQVRTNQLLEWLGSLGQAMPRT